MKKAFYTFSLSLLPILFVSLFFFNSLIPQSQPVMGSSNLLTPTAFVNLPIVFKPEMPLDTNNWLQYVNYFRNIAGVPPVNDDAILNNNCWEHARYMAENNDITHEQDPNLPFASDAGQICAENGNAWMGGEFIQPYWEVHHSIEGWMGSVGHRLWLLYPTTPTFGYGFYTASNNRAAAALDVLSTSNFGADDSYSGWPLLYPAPNEMDIPAEVFPITIFWKYFGATPTLTSSSLITFGGTPIPHTSDTNLPVDHKGIQIYPLDPLPANTTFLVSVNGSYEGTPFTYTWQFSTGNTLNALEGMMNEAATGD